MTENSLSPLDAADHAAITAARPLSLAVLTRMVDRARGHGHAPGSPQGARKTRTVVRLDRLDLERLDALRAQLNYVSRAALVRALVRWGLDMVESTTPSMAPPATTQEGRAR